MSEPTTAELVERVREGLDHYVPFPDELVDALTSLQSRCEELERENADLERSREFNIESGLIAARRAERAEAEVQRLTGLVQARLKAEADHQMAVEALSRMEAEVLRLREALRQLADAIEGALDEEEQPWVEFARAALSEEPLPGTGQEC